MSQNSSRETAAARVVPDILYDRYRVVSAGDISPEKLYTLYRSNQEYFTYFSIEPTRERLRRDMTMLPDGCSDEQKHFLVFLDADTPVALIDLIEGYPDADTCYIGLFMVDAEFSGRGVGSGIITGLCSALSCVGYTAVRLAYGKSYEKAKRFWMKNGFEPVKEAMLEEYGELVVAQRSLGASSRFQTK